MQPQQLQNKAVIRIVNPSVGGSIATSGKRALHHIRRGHAVLTEDGRLYFFTSAQIVERREREQLDAAIAAYNGGVCLWNGDTKQSGNARIFRRPGEVRS